MTDKRESEVPRHRKKSRSASRSVSSRRADHRHDYEKVILQWGRSDDPDPLKQYYWGKRCRTCGRVVDPLYPFPSVSQGLVKKTVRAGNSRIEVFYTADELREKYPGTPILVEKSDGCGYVELGGTSGKNDKSGKTGGKRK